jgi:TPR repeat protein
MQVDTPSPAPAGAAVSYPDGIQTYQRPEVTQEPDTGVWVPLDQEVVDSAAILESQALARALSEQDPVLKVKYLEEAAAKGSGKAHYELAKHYTGTKPANLKLAREHVEAAASLNDPEASRVIGWMMIKGEGGYTQNLIGGVAVMEVAVKESVRTQRELGMLYCNLYSDYKLNGSAKGEIYLLQAFHAGDVLAAAALGKFYVQQGRQMDAVSPLAFAAERNNRQAAKLLSMLNSEPVQSEDPASQLAQDSGATGEAYYQRGVDIMLHKHSPSDEARAYALFDLAADLGHNLARAELAAISGVKQIMDEQQGPGWLNATKQEVQIGMGG